MNSLLTTLSKTVWGAGLSGLNASCDAKHIRAIIFEPKGGVVAVTSRPRSRDSYHIAALVAHYLVEKNSEPNVGDSKLLARPEDHLASFGSRGMAAMLDTAVILACYALATAKFPDVSAVEKIIGTFFLTFVYYWICEGCGGATPGKIIFNTQVRSKSGPPIGLRASAVRNLIRFVDAAAVYLVGYAVARVSNFRQRLGDRAAGTVVVRDSRRPLLRGLLLIGCIILLFYGANSDFGGPHIIIGKLDKIYYSDPANRKIAETLGIALKTIGFFTDQGYSVNLSKNNSRASISFTLMDNWEKADTVLFYEHLGIAVAPVIGGFPLKIRLLDSKRRVRKELTVGKIVVGNHDEIYYLGSANEIDAKALGTALKTVGFFRDRGFAVLLSKEEQTMLCFVVQDGSWEKADNVAEFEDIARQVAPSISSSPVTLCLMNQALEVMKEVLVN